MSMAHNDLEALLGCQPANSPCRSRKLRKKSLILQADEVSPDIGQSTGTCLRLYAARNERLFIPRLPECCPPSLAGRLPISSGPGKTRFFSALFYCGVYLEFFFSFLSSFASV